MNQLISTIPNVEELQRLYRDLIALEAAYRSQKVCFYKPRTYSSLGARGIQDSFHRAGDATVRLVLGDNRSGKSVSGVCESIAHSLGERPWLAKNDPDRIVRLANGEPIPVPNIGRVIAQNYTQAIKQNIFPKFQEWAPRGWYKVKYDTRGIPTEIIWKNGSVIYFMSDDQEDDVFEGTNGHWFWGDEPFGYRKYVALKRGLIDFSGHAWLTLTPLSQVWIADVIEARAADPDGDVKVFEFSIWDNCIDNGGVLPRAAIESFIADLREDEKGARVGRQWLHLTGRVFKEWMAEPPYWIEPYEIPAHWPRIEVADPHNRKPIAILWAAISPDNQIIVYRDLFEERLRTVDDVSKEVKRLEGWEWSANKQRYVSGELTENVQMRLIDWSSRETDRTSGESIWSRFAEQELIHLLANKRNADAGYDAIHESLKLPYEWSKPQLVVFNTCKHVKQNFLRHVYDDWATSKQRDLKGEKQEVRKTDDDFLDCIRYIFQSGVTYRMLKRDMQKRLFPQEASTALWRRNDRHS